MLSCLPNLPHSVVAGEWLAEISPWVLPFPNLIYFITASVRHERMETNGRNRKLQGGWGGGGHTQTTVISLEGGLQAKVEKWDLWKGRDSVSVWMNVQYEGVRVWGGGLAPQTQARRKWHNRGCHGSGGDPLKSFPTTRLHKKSPINLFSLLALHLFILSTPSLRLPCALPFLCRCTTPL